MSTLLCQEIQKKVHSNVCKCNHCGKPIFGVQLINSSSIPALKNSTTATLQSKAQAGLCTYNTQLSVLKKQYLEKKNIKITLKNNMAFRTDSFALKSKPNTLISKS